MVCVDFRVESIIGAAVGRACADFGGRWEQPADVQFMIFLLDGIHRAGFRFDVETPCAFVCARSMAVDVGCARIGCAAQGGSCLLVNLGCFGRMTDRGMMYSPFEVSVAGKNIIHDCIACMSRLCCFLECSVYQRTSSAMSGQGPLVN